MPSITCIIEGLPCLTETSPLLTEVKSSLLVFQLYLSQTMHKVHSVVE